MREGGKQPCGAGGPTFGRRNGYRIEMDDGMGDADLDDGPVPRPLAPPAAWATRERDRLAPRTSRELARGSRDMDREASRVRVIVPAWLWPVRTSSYDGGIMPTAVSSPETSRASVGGRRERVPAKRRSAPCVADEGGGR